ncbi:MAG: hypothetical protein G3M70_07950 [Candidatus Nitronauta litoralis]|uniref:Uncharacterized protein n=1 Tax=Candidatus Nitronauta litoralis TaxID=2705533 RepID=A0A7T0BT82_9BACT|nr:MAG: hypothetical protein G3M70_07950 [Candidatus Nitronauta litoralis]
MTETETSPSQHPPESKKENEVPEDPGMMESVGSFPCWMLKLIDTVTPDSLRTKEPPKKNYRI